MMSDMDEDPMLKDVISQSGTEAANNSVNIDKELADPNQNNKVGCWQSVDKRLLVSKLFYLFFSSAFGCVAPYLALYFKQIFISPRQLGIIVSVRSFVQFIFAPVWTACAVRYNKRLVVILMAIVAYMACYITIPFIPLSEKPRGCRKMMPKQEMNDLGPLNVSGPLSSFTNPTETSLSINPPRSDEGEDYYYLPWSLFYAPQVDKKKSERHHSSIKLSATDASKHLPDTSPLYLSILMVTTIGYIFGSPSQTLADIATLQSLGTGRFHEYGRQALFGSIGYGIVSFVVGASVSELKVKNSCTNTLDTNYLPCFICFAVLMAICFLVATQFTFDSLASNVKAEAPDKTGSRSIPFQTAIFIVVVFFCGSASGFIGTFLFWHVHELGGPQLLFSVITLVNSSSEVFVYHISHRLVTALGKSRLIYLGLICYGIRFFYYSYCEKPWLFVPIELVQGITTAAVWSAFVYHVGNDKKYGTTLQGIINGVYSGLGYATGGLVGGILVHEIGTSAAFLIYGEACLVLLCIFILTNHIGGKQNTDPDTTSLNNGEESSEE